MTLVFAVAASMASAQGHPIQLSPERCQKFLTESPPEGAFKRAADEIVAFTSLTHPILERVFDHSSDLDFMFDLLFFPTGWMLPPAESEGRSFRQYELSTRFDERRFWGFGPSTAAKLQRRVARLHRFDAADANAFRWKFVQELAKRSLHMICHLANPEHRSTTTHEGRDRHFNMSVLYYESRMPTQAMSVNWDHSFSDEEFQRFEELCYLSREESVLGEVFRQLNVDVDFMVRSQQRLLRALDGVDTVDQFRSVRANLGLTKSPRAAAITPPPVVERSGRTGEVFRDWKINGFLERAVLDPSAWSLTDVDLQIQLAFAHEALDLVNSTLALMSRWRRDDFDWKYFLDRFDDSVGWCEELNAMIQRYRRGSETALTQYDHAARAMERLSDWADEHAAFLARATKDEGRVRALDEADQTRLSNLLEQLNRLSLLIRQTLGLFDQQERLNLSHIAVTGDVSALMSVALQRTRNGRLVDDGPLRQSLKLLAQSARQRAQPE